MCKVPIDVHELVSPKPANKSRMPVDGDMGSPELSDGNGKENRIFRRLALPIPECWMIDLRQSSSTEARIAVG